MCSSTLAAGADHVSAFVRSALHPPPITPAFAAPPAAALPSPRYAKLDDGRQRPTQVPYAASFSEQRNRHPRMSCSRVSWCHATTYVTASVAFAVLSGSQPIPWEDFWEGCGKQTAFGPLMRRYSRRPGRKGFESPLACVLDAVG